MQNRTFPIAPSAEQAAALKPEASADLLRRLRIAMTNRQLRDFNTLGQQVRTVVAGWDPAWQNTWRDVTWSEFWDWFFVVMEDLHEHPETAEA